MSATRGRPRWNAFVAQFELPHRLRDAGVPSEEIGTIAGTVLEEVERSNTVGRPVRREELVQLLEAAY
jgi:alcohol dehydrogenase class IV